MPLNSLWFRGDARLQRCLVSDPDHVKTGDRGAYVLLIQQALQILDDANIDQAEMNAASFGPSTARAVKSYKTKRKIVNLAYQTAPDDIVGKMTIQRLDEEMAAFERQKTHFLLAVGITVAPPPALVVVTELGNPWFKWATQFSATDPTTRKKVGMAAGATPQAAAATIATAIGQANGGIVLLSVGHGGGGGTLLANEGFFDLAAGGTFRIGGGNSVLPGDLNPGKGKIAQTQVFYDLRIPNPALKGGFQPSRKDDDEASQSANAKIRLANWAEYQKVATAFQGGHLQAVILLTCKVGQSTDFLKRVAQQWKTPVLAYKKRVVGQEVNGKARIFLEGEAPGTGSNTAFGEVMFPLSFDMVMIKP
jgi:peptidoglycan hydrolase-like protein with peptidoglycan-binding domain